MSRNFFNRVEVDVPVQDPALRTRIVEKILAVQLADNTNAWVLEADGSYSPATRRDGEPRRSSQAEFMALSLGVASFAPAHAQGSSAPAATPATKTSTSTKTTTAIKAPAAMKATPAAAAAKVDINTATKEQLMALPGIGDAIADKIIAGRPFANKHQLVDKGLVNKGQYSKMTSHIIASGGMAPAAAKPVAMKTTTKVTGKGSKKVTTTKTEPAAGK